MAPVASIMARTLAPEWAGQVIEDPHVAGAKRWGDDLLYGAAARHPGGPLDRGPLRDALRGNLPFGRGEHEAARSLVPGPGQGDPISVGPAPAALFREQQNHVTELLKRCVALAREGKLSAPAQAKSGCLDNPPNTDPVVHDAVTSNSANRSEWASAIPGPDGLSSDDHEVEQAHPSFGSILVLVLTAGDHLLPPNFSKADSAALTKAGQEGHERLAALSTRGEEIVVPHSGHYIRIDQPDVVIGYVKKVVIELRYPSHATKLLQSLKRRAEPRQ